MLRGHEHDCALTVPNGVLIVRSGGSRVPCIGGTQSARAGSVMPPTRAPDRNDRETADMSTSGGTKAIVAALLANLGIAVTKFIAYLLSGSSSMLAESVHSLADSGNQVLLLIGGKRASRAATEEHPFGYGRERYIYAFLVSIILFSVGGVFSHLRGGAQDRAPGTDQRAVGADRGAADRDRAGVLLAADRAGGVGDRSGGASRSWSSSAAPRRLSCPSWCSRTSPRWSVWCWRSSACRWR